MTRIVIEDLTPVVDLTLEQMEELLGAGRSYQPTFEALESREMMAASFGMNTIAAIQAQVAANASALTSYVSERAANIAIQTAAAQAASTEGYSSAAAEGHTSASDAAQVQQDSSEVLADTQVNGKSWMWDHKAKLGKLSLSQITMPGSHDAGMYDNCPAGDWSMYKNQNWNLGQQYEHGGSRFFDLRVMMDFDNEGKRNFIFQHSEGWGEWYDRGLSSLAYHMGTDSKEVVVLDLQDWDKNRLNNDKAGDNYGGKGYWMWSTDYDGMLQKIHDSGLGKYVFKAGEACNDAGVQDVTQLTLEQIWNTKYSDGKTTGKIILLTGKGPETTDGGAHPDDHRPAPCDDGKCKHKYLTENYMAQKVNFDRDVTNFTNPVFRHYSSWADDPYMGNVKDKLGYRFWTGKDGIKGAHSYDFYNRKESPAGMFQLDFYTTAKWYAVSSPHAQADKYNHQLEEYMGTLTAGKDGHFDTTNPAEWKGHAPNILYMDFVGEYNYADATPVQLAVKYSLQRAESLGETSTALTVRGIDDSRERVTVRVSGTNFDGGGTVTLYHNGKPSHAEVLKKDSQGWCATFEAWYQPGMNNDHYSATYSGTDFFRPSTSNEVVKGVGKRLDGDPVREPAQLALEAAKTADAQAFAPATASTPPAAPNDAAVAPERRAAAERESQAKQKAAELSAFFARVGQEQAALDLLGRDDFGYRFGG